MRFRRVVFVSACFTIGAFARPAGLVGCAPDAEYTPGMCGPYGPAPEVGSYVIVDGQVADMVGGTVEVTSEFEETAGSWGYRRLRLRFSAGTSDYDVLYLWPELSR